MRLFVGIELPDAVQDQLAPICRAVPGLRAVDPPNLHITLKFLGEVDPTDAEEAHEVLESLDFPSFDLSLSGLGYFKEGSRRISVIWAGVAEAPELVRCRNKVEAALAGVGFARERRKYTPHVTLARVKQANPATVEQLIVERADLMVPAVPVTQISLFQSHLGRDGASYEVIADYPLRHGWG